jgi:hypothetical protein
LGYNSIHGAHLSTTTRRNTDMQVDLNEDEVAALMAALDQYIPGLREEIGKTENYDLREELKAQEASLQRVVTKLGGSGSGASSPSLGANNPPWGKG